MEQNLLQETLPNQSRFPHLLNPVNQPTGAAAGMAAQGIYGRRLLCQPGVPAATPAIPAMPATPTTPAVPATPAVPPAQGDMPVTPMTPPMQDDVPPAPPMEMDGETGGAADVIVPQQEPMMPMQESMMPMEDQSQVVIQRPVDSAANSNGLRNDRWSSCG
ncbi:MAG: hypothetical protein MZV70_70070 [Desulfobacterales bacterium]|nr:hypothetical protein [Desulfobacterales bacterium]